VNGVDDVALRRFCRSAECLFEIWQMPKFFKFGDAQCEIYRRTRDGTDEHNASGREFIEALWQDYGMFLDRDALKRAGQSMPTVFWELYLANALKCSGVSLRQQRDRTKKNQKGPDLFAANPDVWIEAVMPGPGTGPDAVPYPPRIGGYDVPVDTFILRLRSSFEDKARKMTGYIDGRLIQPGQATVIAISGALLPSAIGEGPGPVPVPRVVQAFVGVGNLVLDVDPKTRETVSRSVAHHDEIRKTSGGPVATDPFIGHAYSHISAVAYSASDWATDPERPGTEFVLIHNDNATVRLPRGWLSAGVEYWRENSELRWTTRSLPPPTIPPSRR